MHPKNKAKAEYCNITLWHQAGYTGKGVKIATLESNTGHGAQTTDILRQVAPGAEVLHRPQPGLLMQGKKLTPESYAKLKTHYQALVAEGVHIVTASLVGTVTPEIAQLQKDILQSNGIAITLFAAAGNFGDWAMGDLAKLPFWIAVGNCDLVNGKPIRVRDSSIGQELDVCGFGVLNISTGKEVTGTSYSCPWVVGMVALWYQWYKEQHNRYPTWQECYNFVTSNTVDLETPGHDPLTGYGLFILPAEIPKEANSVNIIEQTYKWNGTLQQRTKADYIVLHHADASVCGPQDVHQWHLNRGWTGIGYHFFVRKDGSIYRGRPLSTIGAHVEGYNSYSVGICAEGKFQQEGMTGDQLRAIAELVAYLKELYPSAKVMGHRDLTATACPGKNFPLQEIKSGEVSVMNIFKDVKDDGSEVAKAIKWCKEQGILRGDEQGNFNPKAPLTREQYAITLYRQARK